ncbi:MFS transporter [Streptomyces sp. NPDC093224]|uniref:MFS transporter n=1 Tax=Streptomyces sp. NPDC093224 TaxID=3155198 RepID=UPI003418038A
MRTRIARETWGTGRVLRDRNAGLYLLGVVVSGFGTSAMWLVSGVWVKSLTGSDSLAALTVFALWAPLLAGPALGALADRLPRRLVLVAGSLVTAALLPLLLLVDSAERVWLLFVVLFVYGTCGVLHDAAEAALVPRVVGAGLLGDFNGLRLTASEGMKLLAPLAGAALFARFGGAPVALLDAVTFVLAAGVFAVLRIPGDDRPERAGGAGKAGKTGETGGAGGAGETRETGHGPGGFAGVLEGARRLWASPALRPLVAAGAAVMFLAGLNGASVYAVADDVLGRPPAWVGVLYAVQGAGSVLSGLVAGALLRRMPVAVFTAAGAALFAVGVGARALPYDAAGLAGSALIGFGLPCVLIAVLTAVQREVPESSLGRAAATANTLVYVPNALALAFGAGLMALVDVRAVLAAVTVAGGAVALLLVAGLRPRPGRT